MDIYSVIGLLVGFGSIVLYLAMIWVGGLMLSRHRLPSYLVMVSGFTLAIAHAVSMLPWLATNVLPYVNYGIFYSIISFVSTLLHMLGIGFLVWAVYAERAPAANHLPPQG